MTYDEFENKMAEKYPRYCGDHAHFGGYAIGEGWYPIIEQLVAEIDHYTKWKRESRARDILRYRAAKRGRDALIRWMAGNREIKSPSDWIIQRCDEILENGIENLTITPKVEWVHIEQIKEKFGGLRFYYYGGDEHIHGMVRMAELWAGHTCEKCGNKGTRRQGGWVRTLCDTHEAEYQERNKNMRSEDE